MIELNPNFAGAYYDLGVVLGETKDLEGAIAAYQKAIMLNPKEAKAFHNFGRALQHQGKFMESEQALYKAIQVAPDYHLAHSSLAWLLATCPDDRVRDGKRAIRHATRACTGTDWKVALYLGTLGAAYAEVGQFDKAIEYQRRALNDPAYAAAYGQGARQRLELYQNKKPYRDR